MKTSGDIPAHTIDVIEKLRIRIEELRQRAEQTSRPVITLTYAQSIDGCIAPHGGGTLQLSNPKSRQMTHQIRAMHDGILVGINTVICDNPRLSVRLVSGANPQPVVLDSRLRFPLESKLLQDPCVRPIIATGMSACEKKAGQLTAAGARLIRVPQHDDGLIDLFQLMPLLKTRGIDSIMVEGGSRVITSFLACRLADHLLLSIAPRLVAGYPAVNPEYATEKMPPLRDVHYQSMDGDIIVWGHFESANGLNRTFSPTAAN